MEIKDQYSIYHELNLQWENKFTGLGVIQNENENYTKSNLRDRFEWKYKNASKIFAYNSICR